VFFDQISNFDIFAIHLSIYLCAVPFTYSLTAATICWLYFCFE